MIRIEAPSTGHISRGPCRADTPVRPAEPGSAEGSAGVPPAVGAASAAPPRPSPTPTPPPDPTPSPQTRRQSHPPAPAPQTIGTNHLDSAPRNCRSISAPAALHPGICSIDRPLRAWIRHFIPAMRSLITLIARRATGVSANLRKLTGVGFGNAACDGGPPSPPAPARQHARRKSGYENEARFDPAPIVRRPPNPRANNPVDNHSRKDTSPTRRTAPRTASRMFMISVRVARAGARETSWPQPRRRGSYRILKKARCLVDNPPCTLCTLWLKGFAESQLCSNRAHKMQTAQPKPRRPSEPPRFSLLQSDL